MRRRKHVYVLWVCMTGAAFLAAGCGPKGNGNGNGDGECGNGVRDGDEVCDGSDVGDSECTDVSGYIGGTLGCQPNCQLFDLSQCIPETCGNGALDPNEVCDDVNLNGQTCLGLGYEQGQLACTEACQFDIADCSTCGNDVIEGPEACDGPQFGGASCLSAGHSGGQLQCLNDCTIDTSGCFDCGDGVCDGAKGEDQSNCLQDCGWIALSAGSYHTCGIAGDGSAWCWGANSSGQLGNGTTTDATRPMQVSNLAGVTHIAAGGFHSCARDAAGDVWCWGSNTRGQLGDGTTTGRYTPVAVSDSAAIMSLSAGSEHTCGVRAVGHVYCWGYNAFGQLGDDSTVDRPTMVRAAGLTQAASASAGINHSCAVTSGGEAWCWGRNISGQVGDGTTLNTRLVPVQVQNITGASLITAGKSDHTCSLTSSGLFCWGANNRGQLGDGTTNDSPLPVIVSIGVPVHVSAGREHSCAVTSVASVRCWGSNENGKLGDGTTTDAPSPSTVTGLTGDAAEVTAGSQHTCALMVDGTAFCWGDNTYGQLGDGSGANSLTPVQVLISN